MANDSGKTALVSIVVVSFTVGVATGWLLNTFARKVRGCLLACSHHAILRAHNPNLDWCLAQKLKSWGTYLKDKADM